MRAALGDLRTALERQLGPRPRTTGTTLRERARPAAARLRRRCRVEIDWEQGVEVPERLEPVAQATLGEALRNCDTPRAPHARSTCAFDSENETFSLEVLNDGVQEGSAGTGMGLRLAALEALQFGGVVEFGPSATGSWRMRLVVPHVKQRERAAACSWWTTTRWSSGASACCSPSSPGSSAAWPPATSDEALELAAPLRARRRAGRPVPRRASRAPSCARRSGATRRRTRVLLISGAGWISPQASPGPAGASGFVSKDWDADDVAKAVRMVGMGMTVFAPRERASAAPAQLSAREREVLDLIATGATNREIADRLFLSPHTVKEHTSALYRKLNVRNRAEAVRQAQERADWARLEP